MEGGLAGADARPTQAAMAKRSWRNGWLRPKYQLSLILLFSLHAVLLGAFFIALNEIWAVPLLRQLTFRDSDLGRTAALVPRDDRSLADLAVPLVHQVSMLVLLYGCLCIVLGAFLAHRTVGPLQRLKKALAELEAGRHEPCVFRPRDEASEIALLFNQMISRLRDETRRTPGSPGSVPGRRGFFRFWIDGRFQSKFVVFTAVNGALLASFYFAFMDRLMKGTVSPVVRVYFGDEGFRAFDEELTFVLSRGVWGASSFLLLAVLAVLVFSHRTAGPLFHLKACFRAVAEGQRDVRCNLRKGDHLEDVAEAFNRAMDAHERVAKPLDTAIDTEQRDV